MCDLSARIYNDLYLRRHRGRTTLMIVARGAPVGTKERENGRWLLGQFLEGQLVVDGTRDLGVRLAEYACCPIAHVKVGQVGHG